MRYLKMNKGPNHQQRRSGMAEMGQARGRLKRNFHRAVRRGETPKDDVVEAGTQKMVALAQRGIDKCSE